MKDLGYEADPTYLQGMFDRFDKDENGSIDFEE